ncbi:hypothetical protein JCM8547_000965 [Rhodosporidiobolus lusitaniae]
MHATISIIWSFPCFLYVLYSGWTLFRPSSTSFRSRIHDANWWMRLGRPLYMLHQLEEYGTSRAGISASAPSIQGFPSLPTCPITPFHTTYVNLALVSLAALRARRTPSSLPSTGANYYGVVLVNGFFHLALAAKEEWYNPGLATAPHTV